MRPRKDLPRGPVTAQERRFVGSLAEKGGELDAGLRNDYRGTGRIEDRGNRLSQLAFSEHEYPRQVGPLVGRAGLGSVTSQCPQPPVCPLPADSHAKQDFRSHGSVQTTRIRMYPTEYKEI